MQWNYLKSTLKMKIHWKHFSQNYKRNEDDKSDKVLI